MAAAGAEQVEEFIALHHPDLVLVNIAGRRVLGREGLREAMTAGLKSPMAKVFTRLEIEDLRLIRPDLKMRLAAFNPARGLCRVLRCVGRHVGGPDGAAAGG